MAHEDWVRDVAWCTNVGIMHELVATVGEDQKLKIWKLNYPSKGMAQWEQIFCQEF